MYDFHIHTKYSHDCSIDMEAYVISAIDKGLSGICFTDHVDIDYPNDDEVCFFDYGMYMAEIEQLKDKYSGKLEIYAGVEFGMQPHILSTDISFFEDKSFDYVLGSLHAAGKNELYQGSYLKNSSEKQCILDYLNDMIFCAKAYKSYNCLGHADVIARYVSPGGFTASKYLDYLEEALRQVVHAGKGIELNTSGKRLGLPHYHPEPIILKLYKQVGGEIITLGSDSHTPHTVGHAFDDASALLSHCGFKYYCYYKSGTAQFVRL